VRIILIHIPERVGVGEAPKIHYINNYTSQLIAYLEKQRTKKDLVGSAKH